MIFKKSFELTAWIKLNDEIIIKFLNKLQQNISNKVVFKVLAKLEIFFV